MTALDARYDYHEAYTNRAYILGDDAFATFNLTRRSNVRPTSWYDSRTASKARSNGEIEDHASADLGRPRRSGHSHLADDNGDCHIVAALRVVGGVGA